MKRIVAFVLVGCILAFAAQSISSQEEVNIMQIGLTHNNIVEIFINLETLGSDPGCSNGPFKLTNNQGAPGHLVHDSTTVNRMLAALLTAQVTNSPVILTYDNYSSTNCWVWRVDIKKD